MVKLHSLSTRLIGAVALMAIVICGVLAAIFLGQQAQLTDLALEREMKAEYQSVLAAIDYERKTVLSLATFAAGLPDTHEGLAARDRDRLAKALTEGQQAISKTFGYDTLTFSYPPATAFYRVHNPKVFDDDISTRRQMIVDLHRDGIARSGVEPSLTTLAIFGAVPLFQNGQRIGVIDFGMSVGKPFVDAVKARFGIDIAIHTLDGKDYKTLISTLPNGTLGTPAQYQSAFAGTPLVERGTLAGAAVAVYYGQLVNFSGKPIGVIEIVKNIQDLSAITDHTRNYMIMLTCGVLALAVVIGLILAVRLSRPILKITRVMNTLSSGNTAVDVPGTGRRDEIGQMAAAVQVFKSNMQESDRLRREQDELKAQAEVEKKAAMHRMADEFEASVKGVVQIVSSSATKVQASAQSMSATAEETSRQSNVVKGASQEASHNVDAVASATEELATSVNEISRRVNEASQMSTRAVEQASETDARVTSLAEAAQKIGDVVQLINDIANQTNLLALNATIEAARAGDAGKGFAVVASEVKNLATQTAKATEDITAQIDSIQAATGGAVEAIRGISATIGHVNEIATSVAAAVEEQDAATKEIARNVQQASARTGEVSSSIAAVTEAAGETGHASSEVLHAAGDLAEQADRLRSQVDSFLSRVKAA